MKVDRFSYLSAYLKIIFTFLLLIGSTLHNLGAQSDEWVSTQLPDDLPLSYQYDVGETCMIFAESFNPSTIISYSIAKTFFVNLKVYDVLGKEVVTLVNEEKSPGIYEVEFNLINNHSSSVWSLASRIYFYQLQAGNYIETKKMILIK